MPQHDLVLGLDVGTTNLKCLALDGGGTIVAQGSEPTPRSHPRPDWTDFEPEPIWEAACRAIRAVVSQIKDPAAIGGIAVSSLAESVVPIDSEGRPLAPAIAWFDLRTIAEYEWLQGKGWLRNFVQYFRPQSRSYVRALQDSLGQKSRPGHL